MEHNQGLSLLWERGSAIVNEMLQHATTSDRLQGQKVRKQFDSGIFEGSVIKKTKYESLDFEHEDGEALLTVVCGIVYYNVEAKSSV